MDSRNIFSWNQLPLYFSKLGNLMKIAPKVILSVVLLASAASGSAQMLLDTMYFNRQWQQCSRDSAYYYREVFAGTGKKVQFQVKDYYPSGKLQMEGTFLSIHPDRKDGHFVYYYSNGNKMQEADYLENEPTGVYQEWYANSKPKIYSVIKDGNLDGPYKTWSESGVPQLDVVYRNGNLNGKFVSFYENGMPVRDDRYRNGELVNKQCYTRSGKDTLWFPYLQMPQFPGGENKLSEYIDKEMIYPKEALQMQREGQVTVEFSIERDGRISKVSILKSDREYFNSEALRLVSSFPKWIPGRKDGQLVEVTLSLPIRFILKNE